MAEYASDGGRLFSAMDACRGMRLAVIILLAFLNRKHRQKKQKNRTENGFCYGEAKGKAQS